MTELTGAEIERALSKARYSKMTVKFTVDGLGDFDLECQPGELRIEVGRDISEVLDADFFVQNGAFSSLALEGRLMVRLSILPDRHGMEPQVTFRHQGQASPQ